MSTPGVDRNSAEYKMGYTSGKALSTKWKYIREMWAGLGLFLVIILVFVVPDMYRTYSDDQMKQHKIEACGHASDVAACIQAVGK